MSAFVSFCQLLKSLPKGLRINIRSEERSVANLSARTHDPMPRGTTDIEFQCARCGKTMSRNVSYCPHHGWHLCWNCVQKSTFTNKLTCPKCGKEISRVDDGRSQLRRKRRR